MRGLITAGGKGTRFGLKATNKHLAPVYGPAMIQNALSYLLNVGIEDVCIVTSPNQVGAFHEELGKGDSFEGKCGHPVRLHYATQENPLGGIADVIYQGEEFATIRDKENKIVGVHDLVVVLGDNIFKDDYFLVGGIKNFKEGAVAFCTRPSHDVLFEYNESRKSWQGRFGMLQREGDKVIKIEEKPLATKDSDSILHLPKEFVAGEVLVGAYIFGTTHYKIISSILPPVHWPTHREELSTKTVFDRIRELKPSPRGQLEVTDLLLSYLKDDALSVAPEVKGWWCDCGNPETWMLSSLGLYAKKHGRDAVKQLYAQLEKMLGGE